MKHPSFLELDRLALDPSSEIAGSPSAAHFVECERCRSYIDQLRAFEPATPVPEWVVALAARSPSRRVEARFSWPEVFRLPPVRAPWVLAALGALAFGISLLALTRDEPELTARAPYLAAKGGPSVGLFIKRAERVFAWDGVESVSVGDRLRLSIVRGAYSEVAVLTRGGQGLVTLYRARMSENAELPVAWEVNRVGNEERLIVVLSKRELSDRELTEALMDSRRLEPDTWVREYVLPKKALVER